MTLWKCDCLLNIPQPLFNIGLHASPSQENGSVKQKHLGKPGVSNYCKTDQDDKKKQKTSHRVYEPVTQNPLLWRLVRVQSINTVCPSLFPAVFPRFCFSHGQWSIRYSAARTDACVREIKHKIACRKSSLNLTGSAERNARGMRSERMKTHLSSQTLNHMMSIFAYMHMHDSLREWMINQ